MVVLLEQDHHLKLQQSFFKETNTCDPNATQLERLQKECLLPADEINVYLKHLATVAANRQERVKKHKKAKKQAEVLY